MKLLRSDDFGSPEWAAAEKAQWHRHARLAKWAFWMSWVFGCFVLYVTVATSTQYKLLLILDGWSLAMIFRATVGYYQLARSAEEMNTRVDEVVAKVAEFERQVAGRRKAFYSRPPEP